MFNKTPNDTRTDAMIEQVLAAAAAATPGSDEYTKLVDQIDKLMKLEASNKPERVSKETWATIGANLLGILVIVGYEHAHPITSKALGFVTKSR